MAKIVIIGAGSGFGSRLSIDILARAALADSTIALCDIHAERLEQVRELCRGYVDRGEKAFSQVLVARCGKIVLEDSYGMADMAAGTPVADDAIVRIYSMTSAPPSYPTPPIL